MAVELVLQAQDFLDQEIILSKDSGGIIRSDPYSGKNKSLRSDAGEYRTGYSGAESGLVQTDSRLVRQLQPAETEEVTSVEEVFLLERFFLGDFLCGSGENFGFVGEMGGDSSAGLVK